MQWSDVTKTPPPKQLRQFAGLFLVVFGGLAAWRWLGGAPDEWAVGLGVAALAVGAGGLAIPTLVRPIYTGWMIAAFPIGWTISRAVLAIVFFGVITPIALLFRLIGRDSLRLRRTRKSTFWQARASVGPHGYLRQF